MDETPTQAIVPEPQPERSRAGSSRVFWWLLLLLVVYPLSIGPAAHLQKAFPSIEKPIEAAYLPILVVCNKTPPLEAALRWYLAQVWRYPVPAK